MIGSKNNYFENIGKIGKLDLEYVIFEYECPVLFTCRDKNNNLYLCLCYEIRGKQRWIISLTNKDSVIKLLTNKITIKESFKNNLDLHYIVTYSPGKLRESVRKVKFNQISSLNLPAENEYIEAEENEYNEYLNVLYKE